MDGSCHQHVNSHYGLLNCLHKSTQIWPILDWQLILRSYQMCSSHRNYTFKHWRHSPDLYGHRGHLWWRPAFIHPDAAVPKMFDLGDFTPDLHHFTSQSQIRRGTRHRAVTRSHICFCFAPPVAPLLLQSLLWMLWHHLKCDTVLRKSLYVAGFRIKLASYDYSGTKIRANEAVFRLPLFRFPLCRLPFFPCHYFACHYSVYRIWI